MGFWASGWARDLPGLVHWGCTSLQKEITNLLVLQSELRKPGQRWQREGQFVGPRGRRGAGLLQAQSSLWFLGPRACS